MYQKSWNGGKEYMVSALFRYLDLDGNGFLHQEELQKVILILLFNNYSHFENETYFL